MGNKSLLIKSKGSVKSEVPGKWHLHDDIKSFILGIETGDILENVNAEVLNSLISGVPTPWARAKLFWFAFDYLQHHDPNIKTSGLIDFYRIILDEWKGIMALIALFPDRVSFSDPIYMDTHNDDLFEISGAFGRMLLEDSDLWSNQDNLIINPDEQPFVQLVYYQKQLIGSTSPFSIVFTGIDYSRLSNISDIKWYRNDKFEDPVKYLDRDKIQKLYLFLKNINDNFENYEGVVNSCRKEKPDLDLSGVKKVLREWKDEIFRMERGLKDFGPVAKYSNLITPFKGLLNSEQRVYYKKDGSLTFIEPDASELLFSISDLQVLLKEDKPIIGWFETNDKKQPLSASAVHYLQVNDVKDKSNPVKYFALPLSLYGIELFKNELSSLLNHSSTGAQLAGSISDQGNLIVELSVNIDGSPIKLNTKEYEIDWMTHNNKVIMWPNFISDYWNAYYLYSEFPDNTPGTKFTPFFKECETKDSDGSIIGGQRYLKKDGKVLFPDSDRTELTDARINVEQLVTYPVGQVSPEMHRYQVIKSNRPIAGLEIRVEVAGKKMIGGYLIVKNPDDSSMGKKKIEDLTSHISFSEAIVGFDFGSNNSCINYSLKTGIASAKPIIFQNRRLALVGLDSINHSIADRDELLFFSNEETLNGQVKSWLHEHDIRYITNNQGKEIAGGVPVNERNIFVKDMDKIKITTQVGTLHYNMKWLSDVDGMNKKSAFIKGLWMQICADLYADKLHPSELRWSYPGSMSANDLIQYNTIYNINLPQITPILDRAKQEPKSPAQIVSQTEAEAVCKYALSKEYGLTPSNLFLGIDVGGSTSDILLLARDKNLDNEPKLFKQSSVRIAAGVFFDAVTSSASFRRALYNFHESRSTNINVENIREILTESKKAPFYLNNVFDQLNDREFPLFYSQIGREASFVFALPAYVTGLLLYYAGKLAAKTIQENNLVDIKQIDLFPFGKGGRLFHWLQTYPGKNFSLPYFEQCFRAGYGSNSDGIRLKYRDDISIDNKSEVSIGLAVDKDLNYDSSLRFESDIFAEKGIRYLKNGQYVDIGENDNVISEYFERIGQFQFPEKFDNFNQFLKIFIEFVGLKVGFVRDIATLENRIGELNSLITSFIENDPEYKKAKALVASTNRFEYRFPIFMAVGLCYLEKILIPEVFKA